MRVHLCRHAKAAPGDPDALRELTGRGAEQARELGRSLAGLAEPPTVVLTSPLVRARQTAEAVAAELGVAVVVEERLAPGAGPDDLAAAVAGHRSPVATVGHQPDCSEIALALTGHDPGFPVAGTAALELDA